MFLREDFAIKITMVRRADWHNFRTDLGFNLMDVINTKEQTLLRTIKYSTEGENMQTQYSVFGYRIDLYFMSTDLQ